MKISKLHIFLIVALFLIAATCDNKVKFKNPQPAGKKDLYSIPAVFHGKYLELADSLTLTIDAKLIIEEDYQSSRMTKEELYIEIDTVFEIDTLIYVAGNTSLEFKFFGDSVEIITYDVDTLFNLAEHDAIRKYKGFHFLNSPLENNLWKVQIMRAKGDSLMLTSLISVSEIDTINPLSPITIIRDTVENKIEEYILDPSKSEVKKILSRKEQKYGYVREQ